jgi:hypothetical protein
MDFSRFKPPHVNEDHAEAMFWRRCNQHEAYQPEAGL